MYIYIYIYTHKYILTYLLLDMSLIIHMYKPYTDKHRTHNTNFTKRMKGFNRSNRSKSNHL